jgi:hypothetical protein
MAAGPAESSVLDLFKLALELAERQQVSDATSLETYFKDTLSKAKLLARSGKLPAEVGPDVIQLALTLKQYPDIANDFRNVRKLSDLSPEAAGKLLRSLDLQCAV